jgi:predicted PurR-regulated permease PerM
METRSQDLVELRWIRILLILIALPVLVLILKTLQTIFIPLLFAVFVSFIFAPMRTWLGKKKFPTWAIIALMMLVILIFFGLVSGVLYIAINSIIQQFPKYQERLGLMLQDGNARLLEITAQLDLAMSHLPNIDLTSIMGTGDFTLTKAFSNTMSTFMSLGSGMFLSVFFLLFIVMEAGKLEERLRKVMTAENKQQTVDTMKRIQTHIQKYFINKSFISIMTAIVAMLVIWIFGVDFVIVAGLLTFVLNFIPNIGSIIATIFPICICLLQYGFGFKAVGLTILLTSTQMFFGNYFEPRFMGDRLNLSPLVILISLVLWAYIWGVVGMVFAVPITSAINIILKQMDDKSIVSAIISDK